MTTTIKKIGILSTGDELLNGDIVNTNSQYLRQQLIDNCITPGSEILVGDDTNDIANAISSLLKNHDAVITIGGLGPTSDDKTRFGLAKALNLTLKFNEQAWAWIVEMLESKGLSTPETNKQQALLPEESMPIFNANGTACACHLEYHEKDIFMLPGPPNECFPIFNEVVLKKLIAKNYTSTCYKKSWLLFGVSESDIASKLEPIMQAHPESTLGFRVHYPYLEVKLFSQDTENLDTLTKKFIPLIKEKTVSEKRQTASNQLLEKINQRKIKINFIDHATGGLLEHTLLTPSNYPFLKFGEQKHVDDFKLTITIDGLYNYWQGKTDYKRMPLFIKINVKPQATRSVSSTCDLLQINDYHKTEIIEKSVPNRAQKTLFYAVELISLELNRKLNRL